MARRRGGGRGGETVKGCRESRAEKESGERCGERGGETRAAARKEAEALAAADAAAAEERRVRRRRSSPGWGGRREAAATRRRRRSGGPGPVRRPAARGPPTTPPSRTCSSLSTSPNESADLGGVPLGSPTKAHADEDDDADEDLGSPPKRRKTETGLASVMEDDDDAAGALLTRANPWMHAPPVVPAADPGPGRPEPVKGTIGSDDKEPVDGTKRRRWRAQRRRARRRAPSSAPKPRPRAGCRRARGAKALLEGEAERALEAARRAEALSARRASKAAEERKRRAAVIAAESTALAVAHHERALLLRTGIKPWRALVCAARSAVEEAEYRAGTTIARVPFRAWSNRVAAKVSGLRDGAAVISAMDDRRVSLLTLRAWSGWSKATTLASFRAKAKGWDAWVEAVQAAAASASAARDVGDAR